MICKNCGYKYVGRTVGFRTLCENCGEYLHTCFNCAIYDLKAERCRSFTTEAVRDRRDNNYCEEFIQNTDVVTGQDSGKERTVDEFKALFGADRE